MDRVALGSTGSLDGISSYEEVNEDDHGRVTDITAMSLCIADTLLKDPMFSRLTIYARRKPVSLCVFVWIVLNCGELELIRGCVGLVIHLTSI